MNARAYQPQPLTDERLGTIAADDHFVNVLFAIGTLYNRVVFFRYLDGHSAMLHEVPQLVDERVYGSRVEHVGGRIEVRPKLQAVIAVTPLRLCVS